jgi:ABC-2 type transport system ATP-binding protein
MELLQKMGLQEKQNKLVKTLSGGMQRRMNILMALMHDPEILILDEPEAGLDPQSRVLVREYIRTLARVKTVILTTHNMDEAERLADRVAIIDHGKLLVVETPEALKATLGAGDVLELELAGDLETALALARAILPEVSLVNHTLIARGHDLIEKLPQLLEKLRAANLAQKEIKLRANTLEDVFLALTGRKLRE